MSYIDPAKYNELLNIFAKGTSKGILKENYIDLVPLNTFEGKITDIGATINQTYPDAKSMEEADGMKKLGKYKPKSYDLDGDGVPNGADKAPKDGAKHEGIHIGQPTGPTIQTVEGLELNKLTLDERTTLKAYVESIKTTKKAIQELLAKAKGPRVEGGDMSSGLTMPTEE